MHFRKTNRAFIFSICVTKYEVRDMILVVFPVLAIICVFYFTIELLESFVCNCNVV